MEQRIRKKKRLIDVWTSVRARWHGINDKQGNISL